jgi:hypothetical protein
VYATAKDITPAQQALPKWTPILVPETSSLHQYPEACPKHPAPEQSACQR